MRHAFAVIIAGSLICIATPPARAQFLNRLNLDRIDGKLAGSVDDYTHNHGSDRRLVSPILAMPRDLYVYLPPGYDPRRSYPLVLFFHLANVDEHYFAGSRLLKELDTQIVRGEVPPMIVAAPDGTIGGRNRIREPHSFFVNGCGGRFEDHVMQEVVPFLLARYSIRPERQAHALLGTSAGGFGAMSLALKHRDFFGAVATLSGPLNLRYDTSDGTYHANFDPATYRWKEGYDPDEVVGVFYFGLRRNRARKYIGPVFGEGEEVEGRIIANNPADLLFSTDLQPGALDIYINYGGRDNWNFDAQNESFAWLAASRGIVVRCERDANGTHSLRYFRHNLPLAFRWLGSHLLPPSP